MGDRGNNIYLGLLWR